MKKILLLVLCISVMAGCSSLPERKNPDDTIAVLKVNTVFFDNVNQPTTKPEKYMPFFVFYFTVDEDPTLHVVQTDYTQYIIKNLSPGAHKISSVTFKLASSAIGNETLKPVSIPFELKPGSITIIDKAFTINIQVISQYSQRAGWGFENLKAADRSAVVTKLSAESSYKTWELAQ